MTRLFLTFAFAFAVLFCHAQVRIGDGSSQPVNPSAVLELSNNLAAPPSNWKTFLPPNVDFTNTVFASSNVWGIAGSPVAGAVVFNIGNATTNGFAGPGLYFWNGSKWWSIGSATPPVKSSDKMRLALSASLTAYDTAPVNSWIMIQANEYENILQMVQGSAKYAQKDSFMNLPSQIGWNQLYTVGGNVSVSQIPASSYIVAWSVRTGVDFVSNSNNSRIKVSASLLTDYSNYGPSLPEYALNMDTRYYFMLKMPDTTTGPTPSYTAVFAFHKKFLGGRIDTTGEYFTPGPNVGSTLTNSYQTQSAVQFICTPTRQW